MNDRIESIYNITWQKLCQKSQIAQGLLKTIHSLEEKEKLYQKLIQETDKNILETLESEHHYSFKAWLIEKYHDKPMMLFKSLHRLNFIRYSFNRFQTGENSLIGHISTKPKAIEILDLLFNDFPRHHYQVFPDEPPFANLDLPDTIFSYLLEHHAEYCPVFSPLFWAIENHKNNIFDKILSRKPEWLNIQNEEGASPLMHAIHKENEYAILKLLRMGPNLHHVNNQNESIAHILCKTHNPYWFFKCINDPRFKNLAIIKMILDPHLKDKHQQIALCHALYHGHIDFVNLMITQYPFIKEQLFICYRKAIQVHDIDFLNVLYNEIDLSFANHISEFTNIILYAFRYYHPAVIKWLMQIPVVASDLIEFIKLIHFIYKEEWPEFIDAFNQQNIDWNNIPVPLCFQITISLLEKKRCDLIIHLNLFALHPHFEHFQAPIGKYKKTFIDFLKVSKTKLSSEFQEYFFDFLNSQLHQYPNWIFDYHADMTEIFNFFQIDKNLRISNTPLLHFLERHLNAKKPEQYFENLENFIGEDLEINAFDDQQHLFAKLLAHEPDGFERIRKLKNYFPQFHLENLDTRQSNLLHLAVECGHIACIKWCFTQGLDGWTARVSDEKTAFDLALENGQTNILDILRKQIKKSEFISLLQNWISLKKHRLIDYIFSNEQPFAWKLSPFHIQELQALSYAKIEEFLKPKSKINSRPTTNPPPVVLSPAPKLQRKVMNLSHERLIDVILKKNHKQFELFIQAEYQDCLRILFAEHFETYLRLIFQSDCKNMNKTLIRIPAAQEKIQADLPWHKIFQEGLHQANITMIENLLGREAIAKQIQTRALEHFKIALATHPELWFDKLLEHFQLNEAELHTLLNFVIDHENPLALLAFLTIQSHRLRLMNSDFQVMIKLLHQKPHIIESLMAFPDIEKHFIEHARTYFFFAITHSYPAAIDSLMSQANIRAKLKETSIEDILVFQDQNCLEQVYDKWRIYPELATIIHPFHHLMRIELPMLIQRAFNMCKNADNTLLLVGSTIHHLIDGKSLAELNDIDFISNTPPPEANHFKQSKVQPQLFFNNIHLSAEVAIKIEHFVSPRNSRRFIFEDYSQRDFTVNALYCDMQGKIYDPSSLGLEDFREKRIRSIENPKESFAKDPIRILRAIRLMNKGFHLMPEVSEALRTWRPEQSRINYGHLYAMACHMLRSHQGFQVFEKLLQFGLIHNLLQFQLNPNYENVLEFVSNECYRYKYIGASIPKA